MPLRWFCGNLPQSARKNAFLNIKIQKIVYCEVLDTTIADICATSQTNDNELGKMTKSEVIFFAMYA